MKKFKIDSRDITMLKRSFLKILRFFLFFFRVDKRKIVFSSYGGSEYSDSPKDIYEELINQGKDYKYVWILNKKELEDEYLKVKKSIIISAKEKWKVYYHYITAGYIINNSGLTEGTPKGKNTIYVQTWHGIPLKKIGLDIKVKNENFIKRKNRLEKVTNSWDYLLSPNKELNKIFSRSFSVSEDKIINANYPRNDIFFKDNNETKIEKIKTRLKLEKEGRKIILYAPTYRDSKKFDVKLDIELLKKELGKEYILLIKLHPLLKGKNNIIKDKFCYDLTEYSNIQELLLITDVLITDYSSTFFDFSLLERGMIFFPYDLKEYEENLRGFNFNYIETVPGEVAFTTEEIIKCFKDNKVKDIEKIKKLNKKFNDIQDELGSKKIIKKLGL